MGCGAGKLAAPKSVDAPASLPCSPGPVCVADRDRKLMESQKKLSEQVHAIVDEGTILSTQPYVSTELKRSMVPDFPGANRWTATRDTELDDAIAEQNVAASEEMLNAILKSDSIGTFTRHGVAPSKALERAAKTNQDRGVVCWPFNGSYNESLMCVFDGHGKGGELVSGLAVRTLPRLIESDPTLQEDPARVPSLQSGPGPCLEPHAPPCWVGGRC